MGDDRDTARVDPSPEGRLAFGRYIEAFNAGDTARFTAYYTPDIRMNLGVAVLEGREAIAGYYRKMYESVTERLTLNQTVIDADGIAVDITVTFSAHEDAADFPLAPIPKGHKIWCGIMVMYAMRDGKMADIRVARMGPMEGPVPI